MTETVKQTGGQGGIRTLDTRKRIPHFECGAFNRAPPPVLTNKMLACKAKMMAETEEETSNRLFETLKEWNDYLERHVPYFQEPQP